MILRILQEAEIFEIYQNHLKKDFAPDEVKPFSAIKAMYDLDQYDAFGFYEGETLVGYAYFVVPKGIDTALLDYFAVVSTMRNSGKGSECLKLMQGAYPNRKIILETEHPDFFKSQEDKNIRLRRIAFYERNGLSLSRVHTRLYGVDFKIMQFTRGGFPDEILKEKITKIYESMFPTLMNTRLVQIFDLEG